MTAATIGGRIFMCAPSRLSDSSQIPPPPPSGIDNHGRGDPPCCIGGLRSPASEGRMHQSKPGKRRRQKAPQRGSVKAPVDHFTDRRGHNEDQKEESVSESLNGRPVD